MTTVAALAKVRASTINSALTITDAWSSPWNSYGLTWTTSGTPPTLGNGSLTGRYVAIGDFVVVFARIVWGSTTAAGTGAWILSLPFPESFTTDTLTCMARDSSASTPYKLACRLNTSITELFSTTPAAVSATVPFTWTTSDVLTVKGVYQST